MVHKNFDTPPEHRKYLKNILETLRNTQHLSNYIDATFFYYNLEDDIPDDIYLYSKVIDNIAKNDKDAFFRLSSLCLMLYGLLYLVFNKFHKLEKKELSLYQGLDEEINIEDDIEYLYPLSDENHIEDIKTNNYILNMVKVSIQHRDIFELLMQLGFEDSWSRLYSIWG